MADVEPRWRLPEMGSVKLNVASYFTNEPLPNGNRSGIGFVLRDDRGRIVRMVAGSVGIEEEDINSFYSILFGLRRAFYEEYNDLELDIADLGAYWTWENSRNHGVHPNHQFVVQQLNQTKEDHNLHLIIRPIDPDSNRLAAYLAEFGAHHWTSLVIIQAPFGRVPELWRQDMGLGPVGAQFREIREEDLEEVVINEEEEVSDDEMVVEMLEDID